MTGPQSGQALQRQVDARPVWLFDLDNTLYPANSGLMDAVSARINLYLERHLGLPPALAEQMREAYFGAYGSSVRGVLLHCRVEAEGLLRFIHDLRVEEYLSPDAALVDLIESLPGRKSVFTNATAGYARNVLRALGLEGHFEQVFDIRFNRLEGKPAASAYQRVLRALDRPTGACWLVEDTLANLVPAKSFGCRTVWVTPERAARSAFVDFAISDLAELGRIGLQAQIPVVGQRRGERADG